MVYKGDYTNEFEKDFNKLDKSIRIEIKKVLIGLEENPYTGKPLGLKYFREKKVKGYGIYYLIYDNLSIIYTIAISTKKKQQKTKVTKQFSYTFQLILHLIMHKRRGRQ